MKYRFLLFVSCIITVVSYAQNFSNKGTDFWITYPAHIDGSTSAMGIYITSDKDASGTITVGNQTINFSVTANNVVRKFLGPTTTGDAPNTSVYLTQTDGITIGAAIHVVSNNNPVVVYAHIIRRARSGATLVLPSNVWGNEYIVPSYPSVSTGAVTSNGAAGGIGVITVVAAEANTTIQITPTATSISGKSSPYSITLANPGDVYQVQFQAMKDISGTRVKSIAGTGGTCKKIAVFSSTTWSAFDCTGASGGDNLYQQLFPLGAWGKNFITAPFINRPYDIVRIFVNNPTTHVTKTENGVTTTLTSLINNSYYEYKTANPTYIQADLPISVAQYIVSTTCKAGCTTSSTSVACLADPEMVVLNPIEQTINNITVFSAHKNYVPTGQSVVSNCFLNIIIPTVASSSFRINGNPVTTAFVPITGTNYSYLQEDVTNITLVNPVQSLSADSSFIAIAYGFGVVESYGYNAGTNVKDFSKVAAFQNQYAKIDSAITCVNSPFQFSVPLSVQPTTIKWDFSAAPNISPNNPISQTTPTGDSSAIVNGTTLYFFSDSVKYTFTKANSLTQRDTIKLYTTTAAPDGCGSNEQLYTIPVKVVNLPTASFTVQSTGCVTDSVYFKDASDNHGDTYTISGLWNFDDGTTDSTLLATKKYAIPKTYNVRYRPINAYGCIGDTIVPFTVSGKPKAGFSISAYRCVDSTISFKDTSTLTGGTINKWYWNYNTLDTALAANSIRNKAYHQFGKDTVSLQVETNTGCRDTTTTIFTVGAKPQPGFVLPEICLDDGFAIFTDTSKVADGALPFTYAWVVDSLQSSTRRPTPHTGTDKNQKFNFYNADHYNVSLKITSQNGCVDSLTQVFTVNGSTPHANFVVLDGKFCSNDSIRIYDSSYVDFGAVTKNDIYWDYVDASSVDSIDQNTFFKKGYAHLYPAFTSPATKLVQIKIISHSGNSNTCQSTKTKTVTLNRSPKASFVTIPGICYDADSRLITQATADPLVPNATGSPYFSGSGISNASTGLFDPKLSGVGTFPIKYLLTSDKGCQDSAAKNITVWPSPTAKWGIAYPSCEKNNIIFTDSSIANYSKIGSRYWDFGDGTSRLRTIPDTLMKTFASSNNYSVSLKVVTDSGCTSASNIQTIKVNPLPIVSFTLPSICLPDGNGSFNSTSTIKDASESLFSYYWNFGDPNDASSSASIIGKHKYSAVGPVNVQLKITSKYGCVDSLTKVFNTIYPQPKASFKAVPQEVCINDSIHFFDKSNGITSPPQSWNWDLANGDLYAKANPAKRFTDSGTFNISLYVFNGQGCVSDTAIQQIVVHPYPKLNMGSDLVVLQGGTIAIKPKYYGDSLQFKWTPPNFLNNDTAANPKASPPDDIRYYLQLTALGGCSVVDSIFITVLKSPIIPNTFSPNGDGINDTWKIKYLDSYPGATVDVYNRYGQSVFHSDGYSTEWDGTVNGKPLPIGTYYYIVNPRNSRPVFNGSITIIR
jgi:gliding motility-associated-like protein